MLGCPFGRELWSSGVFTQHEKMALDIMDSFRTSSVLSRPVDFFFSELSSRFKSSSFVFVHLRVEDDWLRHCESLLGILHATGCGTSIRSVVSRIDEMELPKTLPLYFAYDVKKLSVAGGPDMWNTSRYTTVCPPRRRDFRANVFINIRTGKRTIS
jgi:hypothetical protein